MYCYLNTKTFREGSNPFGLNDPAFPFLRDERKRPSRGSCFGIAQTQGKPEPGVGVALRDESTSFASSHHST